VNKNTRRTDTICNVMLALLAYRPFVVSLISLALHFGRYAICFPFGYIMVTQLILLENVASLI